MNNVNLNDTLHGTLHGTNNCNTLLPSIKVIDNVQCFIHKKRLIKELIRRFYQLTISAINNSFV